jgi:HAE1 family hydrophobic/amphiphilic exporter-1
MSLPSFSVRQVVLVNLVFVVLLIAGVQAARRIPVDLFPNISFNLATVTTVWSGASPQEVERLLTKKLEDEIDGISGIKELISISSHSLSEIYVEWDETLTDLEYEAAINDLRTAIDRADDLPEDAETPVLQEVSVSESFNILMVAVSDVGDVGEYTMREVARDLQDRLERYPGLRHAALRGARDRELRVLVDKNRALQYDLTLAEITGIIAQNNQNFAGGSFTNSESHEITVRGLGNFDSIAALAATVVKKNPDGSHVLLEDVAEIVDGFEKRRIFGRFNGHPTILLGISKDDDTDIIDLVDGIGAYVDEYRATIPEGIEVALTWDQAEYVAYRLEILKSNLMLGIVFVIFILWLGVGFRNAMLAIIGVPFSFLAALILFPYFDITINSLSLIGFVMVSGMLVDGAIIILENIYRHIEDGVPLKEAAVKGSEEVMWPVTAAVATTVAAFIPMLMVTGTSGEFMSILPKTVIVCLFGSLFEALVILPAHYIDFGSRRKASDSLAEAPKRSISRASYAVRVRVDRGIDRGRRAYMHAQSRVLEHRWAFLAASLAALYFAVNLNRHVPVDLFPSDFNHIMAAVETPTDFGVDQTEQVMLGMEAALAPVRGEITDVTSHVGLSMDGDDNPVFGVNKGVFYISFPNNQRNVADPDRVLNLVRSELEAYRSAHPESVANLRVAPPRNGPPIGKPVAIRIRSENYDQAKRIAEEMKAELASIPGVFNIEDNVPLGPRELRVALNEHRASIHGLTFDDVGFALSAANAYRSALPAATWSSSATSPTSRSSAATSSSITSTPSGRSSSTPTSTTSRRRRSPSTRGCARDFATYRFTIPA